MHGGGILAASSLLSQQLCCLLSVHFLYSIELPGPAPFHMLLCSRRSSGCFNGPAWTWVLINAGLAGLTAGSYFGTAAWDTLGWSLIISRSAGALLNLNVCALLLCMARGVVRKVVTSRQVARARWACVPDLSDTKTLHIVLGWIIIGLVLIHVGAHIANFIQLVDIASDLRVGDEEYPILPLAKADGSRWAFPAHIYTAFVGTIPGITGIILVMAAAVIAVTARRAARAKRYEVFWWTHVILAVVWVAAMCVHGTAAWLAPPASWIWLCVPVLFIAVYAVRRVWPSRCGWRTHIAAAGIRPGRVVRLELQRPKRRLGICCGPWLDMKWSAGEWVFIRVPDMRRWQWHAFTVSSAPPMDRLVLNIKPAGGFTSALMRVIRNAVMGPITEEQLLASMHTAAQDMLPDHHIAESEVELPMRGLRPEHVADLTAERANGQIHVRRHWSRPVGAHLLQADVDQHPKLAQALPRVQIDGPYASPMALALMREESVMLVGAGIGGTPLASLLVAMTAYSLHAHQTLPGIPERLPKRVTLVWVCRHAAQFEPMWAELQAAAEQAEQEMSSLALVLDVQLFVTAGLPTRVAQVAHEHAIIASPHSHCISATWIEPHIELPPAQSSGVRSTRGFTTLPMLGGARAQALDEHIYLSEQEEDTDSGEEDGLSSPGTIDVTRARTAPARARPPRAPPGVSPAALDYSAGGDNSAERTASPHAAPTPAYPQLPPELPVAHKLSNITESPAYESAGSSEASTAVAPPALATTLESAPSPPLEVAASSTSDSDEDSELLESMLVGCLRPGRPEWPAMVVLQVCKATVDTALRFWQHAVFPRDVGGFSYARPPPVVAAVPAAGRLDASVQRISIATDDDPPSFQWGMAYKRAASAKAVIKLLQSLDTAHIVMWGVSASISTSIHSPTMQLPDVPFLVLLPSQYIEQGLSRSQQFFASGHYASTVKAATYLCGPAVMGVALNEAASMCTGSWVALWVCPQSNSARGVQFSVIVDDFEEPFY